MRLEVNFPQLVEGLPFINMMDGLPRHKTKRYAIRKPFDIDAIVVHHFASEAPIENQAKYHVNNKDRASISYHIVIDRNRIAQVNDLLAQSAHCMGHNNHTIGIVIRGDLSKRAMTDVERELLYKAIIIIKKAIPSIQKVYGHNELVKTACPCTDVNRIRKDVNQLENAQLNAELDNTPNATMTRIYAAKGRLDDLYKLATTQGQYQAEAQRKMTRIADMMVKEGILRQ